MNKEKALGIIVNIASYVLAFAVGYIPYYFLVGMIHPILAMFVFTLAATLVMYVLCVIFKNTSLYDPYWSVQTVIIYLPLLFFFNNWNMFTIIPFISRLVAEIVVLRR